MVLETLVRAPGALRLVHAGRFTVAVATSLILMAPGCTRRVGCERIVLIVVDTLRRDHLSIYGSKTPTPRIDRLAASGNALTTAVASFHQTSMSMGALFTGRTPSLASGVATRTLDWNPSTWCGLARFATDADEPCIPQTLPTLGEVMHDAGYWAIGVTPHPLTFRPYGFDRGFDEWIELRGGSKRGMAFTRETRSEFAALRSGSVVNAAVVEVLERRPTDRFFLYVHYLDVHDWGLAKVSYADAVTTMDGVIGELVDSLESRNLLEDACVVLTADHGEALGETHLLPTTPQHVGNPSFEPVLQIPLIMTNAEITEDPDAIIRSEDTFRILARLAGADRGNESDDLHPGELFLTERAYRTYRSGRWKSFWGRYDGTIRLVDLNSDPEELRDLASRQPDRIEEHRHRIDELSAALAAPHFESGSISPEHLERLRVLGYIDPVP